MKVIRRYHIRRNMVEVEDLEEEYEVLEHNLSKHFVLDEVEIYFGEPIPGTKKSKGLRDDPVIVRREHGTTGDQEGD